VTTHQQKPRCNKVDCSRLSAQWIINLRRAFKPVVQIGWNIAAFILGGKVREARDMALYNDFDIRLAYNYKLGREIQAHVEKMMKYPD
jgi:hypothetical protein